jgi:hypothetical protein
MMDGRGAVERETFCIGTSEASNDKHMSIPHTYYYSGAVASGKGYVDGVQL